MRPPRPTIENCPGIVWKPRKDGWEARWQARTDLAKRGYEPKSIRLWAGVTPDENEHAWIAGRCQVLQAEMLAWNGNRGVYLPSTVYAGDVRSLVGTYQTDPDSPYHKLRYGSRKNRHNALKRIADEYGSIYLTDLKARDILRWHEGWSAEGKTAMGHAMVGILRVLFSFGATMLECPQCERLSVAMHRMRFKMPRSRNERLTAEQVVLIRAEAHRKGLPSIAKAQAVQYEGMLRQRDVIGEWVPMSEPGVSDVTHAGEKWVRGIRAEEIDANGILRHMTSKRDKPIEIPLRHAPMVMEEFPDGFPASGPLIVSELTGRPWKAGTFRIHWRKIADACGVPKSIRNMDTRAGAITEATEAGAELEHIKHAATHSDIATTQRYSRGAAEKTAGVLIRRVEFRNKKG
jgi:hypothetical protein